MQKKRIIIVGAGLSGLYLANLLEERYDVTLLEARDRIGGRVHSINGHDMGPSWIWSHHTQMLVLIDTLGLSLFAQYEEGQAIYDTKGRVEYFNPPPASPSARVKGSLSALTQKLHENLKQSQLFLNTQVLHVSSIFDAQQNKEFIRVQTNEKSYEADYVILTLPPRVCLNIGFDPKLPKQLEDKLIQTPTWMGNSAKCVVEFESAFWRERGLSGFMFSNQGPIGEMHDACTENKAALFGFIGLHVSMKELENKVKEQMIRVFGIKPDQIKNIYFVDWKEEPYTSVEQDRKSLSSHPLYGIDAQHFGGRILFSATEFSHSEGGYLEGAIRQARMIASKIVRSL